MVKFGELAARFRVDKPGSFRMKDIDPDDTWKIKDKEQGADTKLVYVLAHQSREAAKASWAAFSNDPDWKKARSESEVNGRLVDKVESYYMAATDYSPLK